LVERDHLPDQRVLLWFDESDISVVDANEKEQLEAQCQVVASTWGRSENSQSAAHRAEVKCSMFEALNEPIGAAAKACEAKKIAREAAKTKVKVCASSSFSLVVCLTLAVILLSGYQGWCFVVVRRSSSGCLCFVDS
jgi:hypothetical protein